MTNEISDGGKAFIVIAVAVAISLLIFAYAAFRIMYGGGA